MALSADNARVAVTGAIYSDVTGAAAAPTGTASSLTDFVDLGYASEDGVVLSFPDSLDSEPLKAWQNGAVVRTINSSSGESPTIQVTFVETKIDVIETVFGVEVTAGSGGDYTWDYVAGATPDPIPLVVDVIDDDKIWRIYAPKAVRTELGEINLTSTGLIGFQATFACDMGAGGYNLRSWHAGMSDES